MHFAEFKKNVVITSDLNYFQISGIFRRVLVVSYLQIQQTKSLNYRNFNKPFICNIQSLDTWNLWNGDRDRDKTRNLRDRDKTRNLWDRDSQKWVSRRVSRLSRQRPSLETPSLLSDWAVADVTVNWGSHAHRTFRVNTLNNYIHLLAKKLQNNFCLMRQNRHCLSNVHL